MATRKQIQEYLDIRDKIDMTVNDVLNKIVSIDTIPEGEEKNIIKLTVETVEKKKEYMHKKVSYEAAIYDYKVNFGSNVRAVQIVARKYKVKSRILSEEIYKHTQTGPNYVFDKDIEGEFIKYAQEEELWKHVQLLVKTKFIPCSCRACVLLELSRHAYEYLEEWDKRYCYPLWCLHKAASIEWIQKFEMRHRCEISDLCKWSCNGIYGVAPVEPVEPVEPVSKKRCM
ncbi:uncharacterized protein LOC115244228 [Formica exsecta]|uniref:uncharacterized protein LOC115244228 n=1 Tax=Formica exsecta TaxID=72781 RepID=UPI0011415457|nr:uncharacterized protein LOC115244228 [Formica exsecta]